MSKRSWTNWTLAGLAASLACSAEAPLQGKPSGPEAPVVVIEACDSNAACASLGSGAACHEGICKTADQLEPPVWQQLPGAVGYGNRSQMMVQGDTILLAGPQDLLVSRDRGQTWTTSAPFPPLALSGFALVGEHVYLYDFGVAELWHSQDLGRSWTLLFPQTGVGSFATFGVEVWVTVFEELTNRTRLLYAANGGPFTELVSADDGSVPARIFPGEEFVLGRTHQGDERISFDRGATWEPFEQHFRLDGSGLMVWKGSVFGFSREFEGNTWITHVYASHDRGATWDLGGRLTTSLGDVSGGLVSTPDGLYFVGANGSLEVLREPRGSWQTLLASESARANIAGTTGGDDGLFRLHETGLQEWDPDAGAFVPFGNAPPAEPLVRIASDGRNLYGFTPFMKVYRSADGGRTWSQCPAPSENPGVRFRGFDSLQSIEARDGSVWVGSFWAGLYRSDDGCQTWVPLGGGLPTYSSMAGGNPRAVLDVRATDDELYVCTGGLEKEADGTELGRIVSTSAGVIASADGGETWRLARAGIAVVGANLTEEHYDPCGRFLPAGDDLFVQAIGGMYRSSNGAQSWEGPLPTPVDAAGDPTFPLALVDDGARLLAVIEMRSASSSNLFESLDRGATWTPLSTDLPPGARASSLVRLGDRLAVLASVQQPDGGFTQSVLASSDGGATWELLGEGAPFPARSFANELVFTGEELIVSRLDAGPSRLPVDLLP